MPLLRLSDFRLKFAEKFKAKIKINNNSINNLTTTILPQFNSSKLKTNLNKKINSLNNQSVKHQNNNLLKRGINGLAKIIFFEGNFTQSNLTFKVQLGELLIFRVESGKFDWGCQGTRGFQFVS